MGQSHSSRRSSISTFSSRSKSSLDSKRLRRRSKKELSHTFNVINENFQVERININTATEEELMTLPGISRETARHIVEYRQHIGQFKKVEDLAVVTEVGANKLAAIKGEICVSSRRKGLSRSSSCGTPSEESVATGNMDKSQDSSWNADFSNPCGYVIPPTCQDRVFDVNTATMFQLMSIRYINQTMAASILHYRDKKGPFKSVEDLAKVKGLNHRLLGELKQHLCVDAEKLASLSFEAGSVSGKRRHRRSSSVPPFGTAHSYNNGLLGNRLVDSLTEKDTNATVVQDKDSLDSGIVYEVLAKHCVRPPVVERFGFTRHQQPAFRLATWNLDKFTPEKAQNLAVIEVICCTILENGISLIAFQDLGDQSVLETICKELNSPTLKKVQERFGSRGTWKYETSECIDPCGQSREYLGFVYDSKRGISLVKSETLNFPPPNNNGPSFPGAFYITFRSTDNIEFSLLNVHLRKPSKDDRVSESETLACEPMTLILKSWLENIKDTAVGLRVVLGDFSCDPSSKEVCILSEQFSNLVVSGVVTNSDASGCSDNYFDNIWMSSCVQKLYTGYYGIVKQGLWHLAIPNGWSWGGYVTSHCPVWAEFYVPSLSSLKVLSNELDQSVTLSSLPNGGIKHLVNKTAESVNVV